MMIHHCIKLMNLPNIPQMSVAKKQLAEHALFPGSVTENQMSHN